MNPQEFNTLSSLNFKLILHSIPDCVYYSQEVSLPGMSMDSPKVPHSRVFDLPMHGSKIQFESFEFSFIVDEDLKNVREIHKWMHRIHMSNTPFEVRSDGVLHILDGVKDTTTIVKFYDMLPVSISPINFQTTDTSYSSINMTVSFSYSMYIFEDMEEYILSLKSPIS
jgi:hypothetical protein